jgi:alpha-tubulin suppressor-like RCC1 family protein
MSGGKELEPIIAFSPPKINQSFIRFVLTGVTKETDEVEILFSESNIDASSSDRIWRKLQGHETWNTGSWESPPWRMGLVDLEIKLRVFRSKEICFEAVTDERSCLSIPPGSGVIQLFDVLAITKSGCHHAAKQMQHTSFKEGEHVFIVVPPGQALCVHRAMYHHKDVTGTLQSQLSSNPNLLSFGGDFNAIFGDPAKGIAKTLTIDYSFSLTSQDHSTSEPSTGLEYPSSPLVNLPFGSSILRSVYSELSISSSLKNTTEYHSYVEQYLQFHTGLIGNSPNQSNRLSAAVKLREGIIQECSRHCIAISPWSTLLRCCGQIFSEDLRKNCQSAPRIDAPSHGAKICDASPPTDRPYCNDEDEAEDHRMVSACLPFPGSFIVRLVSDGKVKIAEGTGSYLGEYCRTLLSTSSRPVYQHSSGAYFLWHHSDRWCIGSQWSVGTSMCIALSAPSPGAGQAAPEESSDWSVVDSSGAWTDSPGIRCLSGRELPDVLTHQEALIHMVRTQFFSALAMPDSTLLVELRAWLRSLPQGILKGTNSLDANVPQILKAVFGNLKHGMLDSFSWREIAHIVALSLRGDQGGCAEEFLVELASAEGKLENFVETLHAIQLSRPDSPCSAARRKAHILLLDQVDCPLLQDQAFLSRELVPENRARFLDSLSQHVPWARCLGDEAAVLLVCFLRHVLRAAQARWADYLEQVAEKLSIACGGARDLAAGSKAHAAEEAPAADNSPPVVLSVAGEMHSLAVTADGKLFAWGLDTEGRIGAQYNSAPPAVWKGWSGDSCGRPHTRDALGRFVINRMASGAGSTATPPVPVSPPAQGVAAAASSAIWAPVPLLGPLLGRRVRTAASSRSHSLAITEDGCVFGWGILGKGTEAQALHQIEGFYGEHPCEAACGEDHNLVLCKSGRVYAWGAADVGQLGLGNAVLGPFVGSPAAVSGELQGCSCVRIACGLLHSAAVTASGQLFMWGCAEGGRLGIGDPIVLNLPVSGRGRYAGMPMQVRGPLDGKLVVDVSCGTDATMALLKCGEVYGWGVGFETAQDDTQLASKNAVPAAITPVTATPQPTCTWNGPDTRAAVFQPTKGPDGNGPNGKFFSITLLAQYQGVSFEELRAGDYMLNRRRLEFLAAGSSGQ